ncbi:MAG TPA: protein kinase [Bacteroidota bacterium]|nr:protein kinase [Bacteroidota bacterium]
MTKIGKYDIVEELGRGGMGVVYKAHDALMERDVAIKVMSDLMLAVPEIRSRFFREARTAGKLSHENITVVYDVGEDEGRPYIVMEYLTGSDLATLMESKEPITFLQKLDYAIQICRGLSYSHANEIIHRDIKPQNIRIVGGGKVKIMDFGIARSLTSTLTTTGAVIGTPYYMSPEQIQGRHVDKRSDIFSFGVLFYELLTGQKPFTGDVPTAVMFKIVYDEPAPIDDTQIDHRNGLRDVVAKTLAKDPDNRYQDLAEVADALENIVADLRADERKKMEQIRARLGKLISESRTLLRGNKFRKARDLVEQAARMDPANTEIARLRNDITAAEEREAKRVFVEERLTLARKGIDAEELEKALALLQEILKVEPEHAEAVRLAREVRDAIKFKSTGDIRYAATRRPGEALPLVPDPNLQAATRLAPPVEPAPPPAPPPRTKQPTPPPVRPRPATVVRQPRKNRYLIGGAAALVVAAALFYRLVLYVPSPPRGHVRLNVLPWGEVVRVEDEKGTEVKLPGRTYTPCRLELPDGSYYIHVANPAYGGVIIDTVTVRDNDVQAVTKAFAGFDDRQVVSQFE